MTVSLLGTPHQQIARPEPDAPPAAPRLVSRASVLLPLPHTDEDPVIRQKMVKLFTRTLKDWKELLEDRVGTLRARIQEESNPEVSTLLQSHLVEDLTFKSDYLELCAHFRDSCQQLSERERQIVALTDEQGLIQGFCDYQFVESMEKVKSVYIHTIFTAPWNVRMRSPTPQTHAHLFTKGVGLTLIRHVYQDALTKGARELQLRPLPNSESFYKEKLHMRESRDVGHKIVLAMPIFPSLPPELS